VASSIRSQTIQHALETLGYQDIEGWKPGKYFEIN
jgi:phosphoribosylformylglycinamidine (FGAM) synthase PurS component